MSGIYPFGAESFLTEDLKYQYIDFFTWYRKVLLGEESLFYTFALSLGNNAWGLWSYYLASPFNLIVVLFPESSLVFAIFIITALKLGCIVTLLSAAGLVVGARIFGRAIPRTCARPCIVR